MLFRALILLGTFVVGCKPLMISDSQLKSCLLEETLQSLVIEVTVDDMSKGNLFYNYEFSPSFKVPHISPINASSDQRVGANGREIIGTQISRGLSVSRNFKYIKADFTTQCFAQSAWNQNPLWPQSPSIRILVNGENLYEATFEPQVTQANKNCPAGQQAKTITLPTSSFESNIIYQNIKGQC